MLNGRLTAVWFLSGRGGRLGTVSPAASGASDRLDSRKGDGEMGLPLASEGYLNG